MSADLPDVVMISGTITTSEGKAVQFMVTREGYQQWGAETATLGVTVDVLEAIERALADQ